jgi:7-cyano-7-deazaguanine synthase
MSARDETALVLFSGGQDSTVCLAWALDRFARVETVGFDYGQLHAIEMECRRRVLERVRADYPSWATRLGADTMLDLRVLKDLGGTALTDQVAIGMGDKGLPTTFVPGRNILFLTTAAALAYRKGLRRLVGGMCETDYSGYPDCRDETLKALQVALNLGMETSLVIDTPLMWLDKAGTWALAESLGGKSFVELVRTETHTCYRGVRTMLHDWGYGCGQCPACELRARGWTAYIAADPKANL